jgi:hypothetical protein
LEDYPDDQRITFQIVANDGAVWMVGAEAGPAVGGNPPFPVVSVSHPRLRALIEGDAPTMCAECLAHRHDSCASLDHACGCPECARVFGGVRSGQLSLGEQQAKVWAAHEANEALQRVIDRNPGPCIHQDPGQMTIAGLCGACLHAEWGRELEQMPS